MSKDILLIEPDRVVGKTVTSVLKSRGYVVRQVYDAHAAIVEADDSCPDLVICEIQLIGHSGIEFLYEFRSYTDWQKVPVVVFSAVPPSEFALSSNGLAIELGVSRYLYKPATSMAQLIREVDELFISANEPA